MMPTELPTLKEKLQRSYPLVANSSDYLKSNQYRQKGFQNQVDWIMKSENILTYQNKENKTMTRPTRLVESQKTRICEISTKKISNLDDKVPPFENLEGDFSFGLFEVKAYIFRSSKTKIRLGL